mmetsp:Transcript_35331/g.89842  ORF Transcript_35331/g.89842 Transcript_35331/m.89842 type:complete len:296 (-) Transcript_35331:161-1048(-)
MADDDVPLSALARKPSLSKVDDDTPLSSLAGGVSKTPQKRGAPKGSPKPSPAKATGAAVGAGKGAGTAKPKPAPGAKRKAGNSSSSSSYSYSSSSDSEDGPKPARKGGGKGTRRKAAVIKKKKSTEEGIGENEGGPVKKRDRSTKEDVVAQLLCRWWFSDEYKKNDWPPQDEAFYQERLEKQKFRKVTIQEWEWLPEEDDKGRKKVYELSQFRGVFRNSAGDTIDLRPQESCPCLSNFMKKDMATLCSMLISAYDNQLKDIKHSRYIKEAEKTQNAIKTALTKIRTISHQANQMR